MSGTRVFNQPGCSTTNSCYPGTITAANTGGNTNYNSLQLSAEQRVRYGLNAALQLHLVEDARQHAVEPGGHVDWQQQLLRLSVSTFSNFKQLDYGPSDFDHHNVVSAVSYVYTIPKFLKNGPSAVRYILNDWSTTGLVQYRERRSADHFSSATTSTDRIRTAIAPCIRRRRLWQHRLCRGCCELQVVDEPGQLLESRCRRTYGNVVKGSFVGPHYIDWDASLARKFAFTERTDLQFRAEYFNLMNHTNLGDPGTTVGASTLARSPAPARRTGPARLRRTIRALPSCR